jgi:hypothetical protein
MATLAEQPFVPAPDVGDERFFLRGAIVMSITIVSAFAFQYLMGRSTFAAPLRVHLHAWVFMGWVGIYLLQNIFVATGRMHLHRRLGWIAAAWLVPMIIMGFVVTVAVVRHGYVPFFFRPAQFLIFDPVTVLTFAGLTIAAVVMRRRTQWHRRLHFCAMSMLLVPAFGRLLPMPLLQPFAWESAFAAAMLFPIVGAWADVRRSGHVHPAWWRGMTVMILSLLFAEGLTFSPFGPAAYAAATVGSRGASIAPLEFAPPPPGPLLTGRQ